AHRDVDAGGPTAGVDDDARVEREGQLEASDFGDLVTQEQLNVDVEDGGVDFAHRATPVQGHPTTDVECRAEAVDVVQPEARPGDLSADDVGAVAHRLSRVHGPTLV